MTIQTQVRQIPEAPPLGAGDVLACGFAMTVGAWIVAYISRLPAVNAPGQVTVLAMLLMIFLGGVFTARYARRGWISALLAGAVSGLLNNLIVGSILHEVAGNATAATIAASAPPTASTLEVPAVALWVGGSIVCNMLVAGAGGLIGALFPAPRAARERIRWTQVFAIVLAAATLPLISIGGFVTAFRAGLAVPDWPRSYGYNMFLFPLSKMQSSPGNFYEHAHRLMGSLVGFTALTLAIYTTFVEKRAWVKTFIWCIGGGIAIQGILGGTRVTEKNIDLAIAHGVFAQLVFAAMACFAAVTSRSFATLARQRVAGASMDRGLSATLLAAMVVQLILGALVRHENLVITIHITMAVFVTFLVLTCGVRSWGLHGALPPLKKAGIAIMLLVALQIILGLLALVFRAAPQETPTLKAAFLTTAHQANGALLLAFCSILTLWTWRLLVPAPTAENASRPPVPATPADSPDSTCFSPGHPG